MKEAELNSIISKSLNNHPNSICCKIPDGQGGRSVQLPFDMFGAYEGIPYYGESKLIKSNLNAWNFANTVEAHQFENLHFYNNLKTETLCLFNIGYFVPNKLKLIFFFNSEFVYSQLQKGLTSFKKPCILQWYNNNKFLIIKKGLVQDLHLLREKIIYDY